MHAFLYLLATSIISGLIPHVSAAATIKPNGIFSTAEGILVKKEQGLTVPIVDRLEKRQSGSTESRNDLTNGSPCKPVSLIYARGTFEAGNLGAFTGPPFVTALGSALGTQNLAVSGVNYSANAFGFLFGGDLEGAYNLALLANLTYKKCPSTKIVLSGYSQGAQVVHKGALQLSAAVQAKISAVILFGDPLNSTTVGNVPVSKVKVFCNKNDNICQGGWNFFGEHLTYNLSAAAAATFVKNLVLPV